MCAYLCLSHVLSLSLYLSVSLSPSLSLFLCLSLSLSLSLTFSLSGCLSLGPYTFKDNHSVFFLSLTFSPRTALFYVGSLIGFLISSYSVATDCRGKMENSTQPLNITVVRYYCLQVESVVSKTCITIGGAVAQSVEHATPGEEVLGSIPAVAARTLLVMGWVGVSVM